LWWWKKHSCSQIEPIWFFFLQFRMTIFEMLMLATIISIVMVVNIKISSQQVLWFLMISYDFLWFFMISYDFLWLLMVSPQEVLWQSDASSDSVSSKHSPIVERVTPKNIKIQDWVLGKLARKHKIWQFSLWSYQKQIYCRLGLHLGLQINKICIIEALSNRMAAFPKKSRFKIVCKES